MKKTVFSFRAVGLESLSVVLGIYEQAPQYFLNTEGALPDAESVKKDILAHPTTTLPSYQHQFCLVEKDGEPIAVLDLHLNHPEAGVLYVGLLVLPEKWQKQGLGRMIFEAAEEFFVQVLKAERVRLGVSRRNPVHGFWGKMGFRPTGSTYQWQGKCLVNEVDEMEKSLSVH